MSRNTLAVMVKAPVPGRVKTRLVPPLTGEEAAALYGAFLVDIFSALRSLPSLDLYVFHAPFDFPLDAELLGGLVPESAELIPQQGDDLGERMENVFRHLLGELGYDKAAIIGSDSPDLPVEYIERAYGLLDPGGDGVVLGPAEDGGYYLIGAVRFSAPAFAAIFRGMEWSTDGVFDETLRRCAAAGIAVKTLETWYDVDTVEEIKRVRERGEAVETCRFIEASLADRL